MVPGDSLFILAAGAFLALAAGIDLLTRKIPDWLTYPALSAGALILAARCQHGYPVWPALLLFGASLALTYTLWLTGCWGGGDAKAVLAVLIVVGPVFPPLYFAIAYAGSLALLLLLKRLYHQVTGDILAHPAARPLGSLLMIAYILSAAGCAACFGGVS